jgi:hypothetical protein
VFRNSDWLSYAKTGSARVRARAKLGMPGDDVVGSAGDGLCNGGPLMEREQEGKLRPSRSCGRQRVGRRELVATRQLAARTGGLSRRSPRG